jgi:uncharacterized protein (DUF433 family)
MVETPLVTQSADILSGVPVFAGTRVPVRTLLDYLAAGDTVDEFLIDFPSVSRDVVTGVLAWLAQVVQAGQYAAAA